MESFFLLASAHACLAYKPSAVGVSDKTVALAVRALFSIFAFTARHDIITEGRTRALSPYYFNLV